MLNSLQEQKSFPKSRGLVGGRDIVRLQISDLDILVRRLDVQARGICFK